MHNVEKQVIVLKCHIKCPNDIDNLSTLNYLGRCGIFEITFKRLDGFYYLLNFKDHFSKYVWSFLLKNSIKSCVIRDCPKELLEIIPGRTINSIHTDNGS